jgi:YHS domain-containing protein
MARCPVCGVEVVETDAPAKRVYNGRWYYFCCVKTCKAVFEMEPERYANFAAVETEARQALG